MPHYALGSPLELPLYFLLGVAAGLFAWLFVKLLYGLEDLVERGPVPQWLVASLGALGIGALGLVAPHVFGVGYDTIEAALGGRSPVIRCMPNTPVLVGAGMTVLAAGRYAGEAHLERARAIFDAVGRTIVLDERHMDSVTGMSGSGPAYLYLVIESLAEAGVKLGIPRESLIDPRLRRALGTEQL